MTVSTVKNMGASVRQRLLNHAKANVRPFAEVLQYYAMERFLYRLSVSPHADKFLLKGSSAADGMARAHCSPDVDIDLLGRTDNAVDAVAELLREVALSKVPEDGIIFHAESFSGTVIREDADYSGVRVTFTGQVENARVPMQIDIRFGDALAVYAALALLVCLGMAATAQAQTAAFNTANVLNVGSSPLSSQTMSR